MSGYTPGSAPASRCPHVTKIGDPDKDYIERLRNRGPACSQCSAHGPNLWLCLHEKCLEVGCGETLEDHSSRHVTSRPAHSLTLNLTSLRVWCYSCRTEVFLENNDPPLLARPLRIEEGFDEEAASAAAAAAEHQRSASPRGADEFSPHFRHRVVNGALPGGRGSTPNLSPAHSLRTLGGSSGAFDESDEESDDDRAQAQPRGLTGLQNLGNTCYMNSAIQALSNCPPLSQFFLDCDAFARSDLKPKLSESYKRLLEEMWHKRRPAYVSPTAVAHGIKAVHPMFRGYAQQDTQEFLRCFMDQIHEELKVAAPGTEGASTQTVGPATASTTGSEKNLNNSSTIMKEGSSSSVSEIDYETCDSGLSSERSKTAEGEASTPDAPSIGRTTPGSHSDGLSNHVNGDARHLPDDFDDNPGERDVHIGARKSASAISLSGSAGAGVEVVGSSSTGALSVSTSGLRKRQVSVGSSTGIGRRQSESQSAASSPHGAASTSSTDAKSGAGAAEDNSKRNVKYRSIISDVFDGKILSSVQCLTCDRVSTTLETFQDLSLPIPNREHLTAMQASHAIASTAAAASAQAFNGGKSPCTEAYPNQGWIPWMFSWLKSWFWGPVITLHNCLQAFFSADELKGDNMYSCERCKKLRNGIKYSRVLQLPEVLCVHLKRFRHEFMFSSKISSYVSFPLESLDMRPYVHRDSTETHTLYDLIGVICHHGTAGGGHYTAYALNPISAQWYEYDDESVTEVDPNQVETCEPYVLFYRKHQMDMPNVRAKAVELMRQRERSLMQFAVSKQWINKFNTFSRPGPISNDDFLCAHGAVPPHLVQRVDDMVMTVSQSVWEYLHGLFGGGPAVNRLYPCAACQQTVERLVTRQKAEFETFVRLNQAFQAGESPCRIYGISMAWFKRWEAFGRGREKEPPGPIDNAAIADGPLPIARYGPGHAAVRPGSDYGQLSAEMFAFLQEVYGGGPVVVVHPGETESAAATAEETNVKGATSMGSVVGRGLNGVVESSESVVGCVVNGGVVPSID